VCVLGVARARAHVRTTVIVVLSSFTVQYDTITNC